MWRREALLNVGKHWKFDERPYKLAADWSTRDARVPRGSEMRMTFVKLYGITILSFLCLHSLVTPRASTSHYTSLLATRKSCCAFLQRSRQRRLTSRSFRRPQNFRKTCTSRLGSSSLLQIRRPDDFCGSIDFFLYVKSPTAYMEQCAEFLHATHNKCVAIRPSLPSVSGKTPIAPQDHPSQLSVCPRHVQAAVATPTHVGCTWMVL